MTAFHWRRAKGKKSLVELTDDSGSVLATARPRGLWTADAEATLRDGKRLLLRRPSIWRSAVEITDVQSGQVLGTFRPRWTGEGKFEWSGKTYLWKNRGWWRGRFAWLDSQGGELLLFEPRWTWSGTQTDVRASRTSADQEILLVAGWYLLRLQESDTAASTAGSVVAIG